MEAEDLTEEQIATLEKKLLQEQEAVHLALERAREGAKPVSLDQPIGRLSRMDELQRQSMAKTQKKRDQLRLQQIASALDRIRRGVYGICMQCEMPIGFRRLESQPHAAMCLECQGRSEVR